MILLRRVIPLKSQEEIGYDLGLIVPKKDKKLFKKVRTGKKPKAGWGTQTEKITYSINNFFRKNQINLKEKCYFLIEQKEIKKFLRESLNDKDIIVCFNYKKLYNKGGNCGHVSIIESIRGNYITLIDPEYKLPKYRKVSLKQLSTSIKFHGREKRAGFWVIS